jgi:hypothetical protein
VEARSNGDWSTSTTLQHDEETSAGKVSSNLSRLQRGALQVSTTTEQWQFRMRSLLSSAQRWSLHGSIRSQLHGGIHMQRITGKLDAVNIMREQSREVFREMPKQKYIADKRRKQPRYKTYYGKED